MTELDPRHQEMLDAFRAAEEPPPDQLEAVLEKVLVGGPPPPPPGLGKLTLLKGGLAAALVAAVAAPFLLPDGDEPGTRAAPVVAASESPALEDVAPLAPTPEIEADPVLESVVEARPSETAMPRSSRREVEPAPRGVAAEVELMGQIRRAIQSEDHRRALKLLRRHERTFPDGVFADERRVSLAEALCASGKDDRGKRVAAAFVAERPDSPFLARARRACDPHDLGSDTKPG